VVESSFVRQKNSANIMMKNVTDLCFGALGFWACGWGVCVCDAAMCDTLERVRMARSSACVQARACLEALSARAAQRPSTASDQRAIGVRVSLTSVHVLVVNAYSPRIRSRSDGPDQCQRLLWHGRVVSDSGTGE